jgi:Tfp pilus assembly protein PilO
METSERRVQPRLDLNLQQFLLTSLKSLQQDARVLVIILEIETILIGGHQVMFEECFQNINKG